MPCSTTYNATRPAVQKVRKDELTASDIVQYMDDARTLAATEELSWLAQSKMAKTLCYLGLQDAAQKQRLGSQRPGAWAGAVVSTDTGMVLKSVSKDRWVKTQQKVRWIAEYLKGGEDGAPMEEEGPTEEDKAGPVSLKLADEFTPTEAEASMEERNACPEGEIPFKQLERIVGFLVYVSQTYNCMVPYLKGIYLTSNSWRHGRDEDGWVISKQLRDEMEELDGLPPPFVQCVTRLKYDVEALMFLTCRSDPPEIPGRARYPRALYMVGDASGRRNINASTSYLRRVTH